METKTDRRQQKRNKARHGMQVRGRSLLTLATLPGVSGLAAKRKRGKNKR